jgi:opacity protein-like surface antigen
MVVRASDIRSKAFLHRATAFLVSLAFLAQIASAQAQNQFDWTGFYAGPHVGYGSMRAKSTLDYLLNGIPTSLASVGSEEIPDSYRINSSGFAGGGQAGFNFQSNKLVFGFEADLSFLTLNGSSTATGTVTSGSPPITMGFISSRSQKIQWLGTVRGRVGHTASDSLLLYLTGGLALGGVEDSMRLSFLSVGGTTYAGSSRVTPLPERSRCPRAHASRRRRWRSQSPRSCPWTRARVRCASRSSPSVRNAAPALRQRAECTSALRS